MSSKSILDMIRERQLDTNREFERAPVSADDWQEFKRKFVDEYGGDKVKEDGMTHKEFLQYLKDGTREGCSTESVSLRNFLNNLDKI